MRVPACSLPWRPVSRAKAPTNERINMSDKVFKALVGGAFAAGVIYFAVVVALIVAVIWAIIQVAPTLS